MDGLEGKISNLVKLTADLHRFALSLADELKNVIGQGDHRNLAKLTVSNEEVERLTIQLRESRKAHDILLKRHQRTTVQLEKEIKARGKLQEEKAFLEDQLIKLTKREDSKNAAHDGKERPDRSPRPTQRIIQLGQTIMKSPFLSRRTEPISSDSTATDHSSADQNVTLKQQIGRRTVVDHCQHNFAKQLVNNGHETCDRCKTRIEVPSVKCTYCRLVCHLECAYLVSPKVVVAGKDLLVDHTPVTPPTGKIPGLIVHCVKEIERRGLDQLGLYRISGSDKDVKALLEQLLNSEGDYPDLSEVRIHVLTGALKLLLRKEPLVPEGLAHHVTRIGELDKTSDIQMEISTLLAGLEEPNKETLIYLVLHLQKVAHSPACRMPESNLAKIFSPTIFGAPTPPRRPSMNSTVRQLRSDQSSMEKLLLIPADFWRAAYSQQRPS